MKVLTKEETARLLGVETPGSFSGEIGALLGWLPLTNDAAQLPAVDGLDKFVGELFRRLPPVGSTYAIPSDAAAETTLAKFLACLLLKNSGVCVYLTGWNLQPASEHLDLFYGYRRSAGEMRLLAEAPVHHFDQASQDALVSVLCMVLYFGLEAAIFDMERKTLVRIDHQGWMEIQSSDVEDIREFAEDPEKFLKPLLGMKKSA